MSDNPAEIVGFQALAWVVSDEDRCARFLDLCGLDLGQLKAQAQSPETLAAILDFVLAEDEMVLALCSEIDMNPDALVGLRNRLPGGDLPHWT